MNQLYLVMLYRVHLTTDDGYQIERKNPVVKGNNYKRLLQIQLSYDHGNENHKLCTQINVSVAIEYQKDIVIMLLSNILLQ
jgi:transcriptional regulator CtsR